MKEIFALYQEESIMFTTIFSLALRKAGKRDMAIAFLIPLECYGVIGEYAATKENSSTGVGRG